MEIRLDQLSDPHYQWQERLELAQDGPTQDDHLDIDAIDCRGTIDSTISGYVLRLQLAYRQKLSCVRCLRDFQTDISRDLDLLLSIRTEASKDEDDELGLEPEDLGTLVLSTPVLDTRPLVIEQAHLAHPMKPLCQKDCAGLCGNCGADLNNGSCDCEAEVDPRWAMLKGLKKS